MATRHLCLSEFQDDQNKIAAILGYTCMSIVMVQVIPPFFVDLKYKVLDAVVHVFLIACLYGSFLCSSD